MNDEKLRSAFATNYKLSAKPTPILFIIHHSLFIFTASHITEIKI